MTRRLMVVAHPDDEILWGGGLPIAFPGDWTIIACSIPHHDPVRAYCFFRVCEELGAKARLLPFTDGGIPENLLPHLDVLGGLEGFDEVVTHGASGEYGHPQHIQVHNYVNKVIGNRPLTTFGFGTGENILRLHPIQVEKKLQAFKNYDYIRQYGNRKVEAWEALTDIHYTKSPLVSMAVETYSGNFWR